LLEDDPFEFCYCTSEEFVLAAMTS